MNTKLLLILISISIFSCVKKVVLPECHGVVMEGNFEKLVGKWRWYSTRVKEWFDSGPDLYHSYTPTTEGFDYYFTISSDGMYRGYRDNVLVHEHILNEGSYASNSQVTLMSATFNYDCTDFSVSFSSIPYIYSYDSMSLPQYPIKFLDIENHLESKSNYFVRE